MNDCDGSWGRSLTAPLEMFPRLFGVKRCLTVQVRHEGFDVFSSLAPSDASTERDVDGGKHHHMFRFEHRQAMPTEIGQLHLQLLTAADDKGRERQNWQVHRVNWGLQALLAAAEPEYSCPGVNSSQALHPRKLFVSGLDKGDGSEGAQERTKAMLERDFKKYGDELHGAAVNVLGGGSYALVMCGTEAKAGKAMAEMREKYKRLTRASKTAEERKEMEREKAEKEKAERETAW